MKRWIVGIVAVSLLAAAAGVIWRVLPQHRAYLTDAESIKEPTATARVRDVLWEPPTRLPDLINTDAEDYEPRLSADGTTLFFVRGKAGQNANIYRAIRTPHGWGDPQPLAQINSEADDLGPQPSPDGNAVYFYSNRAGGYGGYDIWVSRRGADGDWRAPENLGPTVNSGFNDYGPALSPDGRTLYFSSNRPQAGIEQMPDPNAWSATLREDLFHRTYDLYVAAITDRGMGAAEAVESLNTPYNEGAPAVSSFGDFLYFASDRPGGSGAFDLYRSRRLRGGHEAATNLGNTVNTTFNELDPALSMGGFGLDFSSDRPVAGRPSGAAREYDLYHTNSREVFAEVEQIDRAPIDWAALWRVVGPNLFWALLALLLLLLLLMLFKGVQNRKLSLLTRCLIASLAAHVLLMLLFNVWQVTTALAGEWRRAGPIRIALASAVRGDTIASQIRGNLADFDTPPPAEVAVRRQLIPLTATVNDEQSTLPVAHQPVTIVTPLALEASVADAAVGQREASVPAPRVELSQAALMVDVSRPPDVRRVDASEPDAAAQARPVEPQLPTRPPDGVLEAPTTMLGQASFPPSPNDIPAGSPRESLAPPTAPNEASPPPQSTILKAPQPPTESGMLITEFPPPDESDRMRAMEAPETPAAPRTSAPLPARAAPVGSATSISPEARVAELRPPRVAQASADVRFLTDLQAEVSDTAPPVAAPRADIDSTMRAGAAPLTLEVKLPAVTSAAAAPSSEAVAAPTMRPMVPAAPRVAPGDAARPADPESAAERLMPATGGDPTAALGASVADMAQPARDADVPSLRFSGISASNAQMTSVPLRLELPLPQETPPESADGRQAAGESETGADEKPTGTIRGTATDVATGKPVRGAMVQLVLPDRASLSVKCGADGRYALVVPPVPEFFALSASRKGFVPATMNVKRSDFEERGEVVVDFRMERERRTVTATEAVPDVHHLGDDRFDGTINSQFQKQSEGSSFAAKFEVDGGLLKSPIDRAEVRLLVKGVQRRHRIYINDAQLPRRLDESPEDGSFGEFVTTFDASILNAGANTLRIVAAPSTVDIDDFEFVNIRVYLIPSFPAEEAGLKEPAPAGPGNSRRDRSG